jgi:hypothetical protein
MRHMHVGAAGLAAFLVLATIAPGADSDSDEALLKDSRIAVDGPGLLDFFRQRTVQGQDEAHIKALIRQLGDDSFDAREAASRKLVALGSRARAFLNQALKDPDAEVQHRAAECLKLIEQGAASAVVSAAVRVLARKKPEHAAEVLLIYLPSADDEVVADAVRTALTALALRDGKAEAGLIKALTARSPLQRAAAGQALIRAGAADQRGAVRKLLTDTDPLVRYHVALALALARDKEAVPVLIALLADAPLTAQDTSRIEEFLYELADDKAPSAVPADDPPARRQFRDAWAKWWQDHGKDVNLAKLDAVPKLLGYTTVVLLDQGQVIDLDGEKKERWRIDNLEFPLDVQYLPGDRVLVAEHNASRVSERNKDNKILWQKRVDSPLVAQRLPNGNTFIATRSHLIELNRDGKELFSYARPGGEMVMRAQKLRNGDIALIVQTLAMGGAQIGATRFVRLNAAGKELTSFDVEVHTSGGRIDVLPNGHVLVPENRNNRVAEYDGQGKVVWEAAVETPISASRLPDGHTLVTSMNPLRGAVELDKEGKELWTFKRDTRVTRAYRR